MPKVLKRFLLALLFFPLLYLILFYLPRIIPDVRLKFLGFNLFVAFMCFMGGLEAQALFQKKEVKYSSCFTPLLGTVLTVAAYLQILAAGNLFILFLFGGILIILTKLFLSKNLRELNEHLVKLSSSLVILLYPGFFLAFLVLMTPWPNASLAIMFFLSVIFINDILAYIAGMLFGKSLHLYISPQKSLLGFIAGLGGSVLTGMVFWLLFPQEFKSNMWITGGVCAVIGLLGITGDLVESALKRAAGVKDSGKLMLGRGGVLDSIDSLLLAAPLFYFIKPFIMM